MHFSIRTFLTFADGTPAGTEIDIYNARGRRWPYYDNLSVFHFIR